MLGEWPVAGQVVDDDEHELDVSETIVVARSVRAVARHTVDPLGDLGDADERASSRSRRVPTGAAALPGRLVVRIERVTALLAAPGSGSSSRRSRSS